MFLGGERHEGARREKEGKITIYLQGASSLAILLHQIREKLRRKKRASLERIFQQQDHINKRELKSLQENGKKREGDPSVGRANKRF